MNHIRIESVPQMENLMPLIKESLAAGRDVCFSPNGDSMRPMLRPGIDSVVLSPVPEKLKQFDLPLYQRDSGKYVLHRVISVNDCYICMGDNQFIAENNVRHDQIIAVVTAFYRADKLHAMDEPAYRLYCTLWYRSIRFRYFFHRAFNWLRRHLKRG